MVNEIVKISTIIILTVFFVSFTYSILLEEVIFIQDITLLICGNLNVN